jgi:hypothetical protein
LAASRSTSHDVATAWWRRAVPEVGGGLLRFVAPCVQVGVVVGFAAPWSATRARNGHPYQAGQGIGMALDPAAVRVGHVSHRHESAYLSGVA